MRKITSLLMLLVLAVFGNVTAFAQGADNTVEYDAYPKWSANDNASVYWVGFLTPGTEDKSYMMSAFQFYQVSGFGNAECYTAICTEVPDYSSAGTNGRVAIIPEASVLAVSTNTVEAGAEAYYTYNLDEEIELIGGTVYYMVFLASNVPNDEGMYTCSATRVRLRNSVSYPAGVCLGNGALRSDLAPGFKATLTMSDYDYALIQLSQLVAEVNFDAESYVMDTPGGYPSELVYACEEAYIEAQDLNDNPDGATLEQVQAAITKLQNAYAALLAGIIPVEFTPGYYMMVNARLTSSTAPVNQLDEIDLTNCVVAATDAINLTYADAANTTLEGAEAEPAHIFDIREAEDGLYTIKSILFNNYVDDAGSRSTGYGFVDDVANAGRFAVQTSSNVAGMVYLQHSSVAESTEYNSLCVSPSYKKVTDWAQDAYASWYMVPVTQETVDALADKINEQRAIVAQKQLNDTLQKYYTAAVEAREAGRSFIFDGTNDGQFVVGDGLIIDATQLFSNAKDPQEGSYDGLLDTDYTTFFHSSWHASAPAAEAHYMQMDLGEEVQTLVLKYGVRSNAGSNDIPYTVTLYGTNDASLLSKAPVGTEGEDGYVPGDTISCEEWTNLGQYTMTYQYGLLDAEGNAVNNSGRRTSAPVVMGAGVTTFELPQAYQYIRLSVDETVQSIVNGSKRSNGDGFNYWNLGSLRAYSGEYDPDCVYAHMDEAARTELEGSISAAATELESEAATQATIDRLKAAYEAFMAIYPDKSKLQAAIDEAKSWLTPAVEGAEMGNYSPESKTPFQTVIEEAQGVADGILTFTAYTEAMQNLSTAKEAFAARLIKPETGYYNIVSLTTGAAKESYLVARSTSTTSNRANSGLGWNYAGKLSSDYVNTLWYVEKLDNGKYTFKNVATGYYMDNTQTALSGGVAQVAEAKEIDLRAARDTAGIGFNFVINEEGTLFGNSDPNGVFVVWSAGNGNDNSAWSFQPASYEGTMTINLNKPVSVHTLPFDVMGLSNAYEVAGITEDGASVALNAISGTITAGTPFVVVADTSVTKAVQAFLTANTPEEIAYAREALTVNGLVGTFEPDTIDEKCLVMNTQSTELTYANLLRYQIVAANSGYFVWSQLQELTPVASGDQLLTLTADLVNGIETILAEPVAPARQGVFTLQGQRVANTRNLPAGVYIVNGRKVLVK